MVDLHTHVLFDIDDGAEFIEDSIDILMLAKETGVDKMASTPHFTLGDDIEDFIKARDKRFEALNAAAREKGIEIELKVGAEVYITDEIFDEDKLPMLAIGGGRVMLSEFKYHGLSAQKFLRYIEEIKAKELIPLIAHPERYSYLRRDLSLVREAMRRGALLQVNAASLFYDDAEGEFARFLVTSAAAAVIGSDVHTIHSGRLGALRRVAEMENRDIDNMTAYVPGLIFDSSDGIYDIIEEKRKIAEN